jgi:hypothetical protein
VGPLGEEGREVGRSELDQLPAQEPTGPGVKP